MSCSSDDLSGSQSRSTPVADARLALLQRWLVDHFGDADFRLQPASADASFRRYFRVTRGMAGNEQSWIAMDAPAPQEDIAPYIRVAGMLQQVGVNAPRVLNSDLEQGLLLNTDLGSMTYQAGLLAGRDPQTLYRDAIEALVQIQVGGAASAQRLPDYDEVILRREMALFPEWFCARHLGLTFSAAQERDLQAVCDVLVAEALAQPRVFVHRDYHCRNLMVCDRGNPGILDFQDALNGPVTYDLVSLLRDCYVAWPAAQVSDWVRQYRNSARAQGLAVAQDERQFLRWFDLMGVQRHLKCIGIFARLWHRDGKPGYLQDIPRTLKYVLDVSARYPELRALDVLARQVLPVVEQGR